MKIAIIGTGYVGLVTGACLAGVGHTVACVDTDTQRINALLKGEIPFYEPGLLELVLRDIEDKNISFHTDIAQAINKAEVCFIAVGTPQGDGGHPRMEYVQQTAESIGKHTNGDLIVVNKSTVPIGTQKKVAGWIYNQLELRGVDYNVVVVSNPEFLKEGSAIEDFNRPDRIIIGTEDIKAAAKLREMYAPFNQKRDKIILMNPESAELTKYASNAMLAARISFMNEIALLCEQVGANIKDIRIGMGADERIGLNFLYAGCGYGGSCFPKDISALIAANENYGLSAEIINAVKRVNDNQKQIMAQKVRQHFGSLRGVKLAVWGLSFKPNTDDIREAPAIDFIETVASEGAVVTAYCPKGIPNSVKYFANNNSVTFAKRKYEALENADALVLMTEWGDFRNPDFDEIAELLSQKTIFDGRNIYQRKDLESRGFKVYQIGV